MQAQVQKPICLLFGANGQVGFELRRSLASDYEVIALDRAQCDMSDAQQISRAIQSNNPALIVNAAAYTAVDKAESESDLAYAINAKALQVIAQEAKKINAAVLHYSTDYVFGPASLPASLPRKGGELADERGIRPYTETDTPAPVSIYGQSKLAGERALAEVLGDDYPFWIIRTSWVYGLHGSNFLKTMLKLAASRESLSVVSNQIGAPTSAALIADVTADLLKARPEPGIYHLSAAGQTNWHEYAAFVIARAQQKGMALRMDAQQVLPIGTADYPTAAKRPAYSLLNCTKIEQALSVKLPDWRLGVEQVVDGIVENQKL